MVAGGEMDRENGIGLVPVMHAGGWKLASMALR
jgi:hypothetical protein